MHVQADKVPVALDRVRYFGVDGVFIVYGGWAGMVFHIDGLLYGTTVQQLLFNESVLYSFADAVRARPRGRRRPDLVRGLLPRGVRPLEGRSQVDGYGDLPAVYRDVLRAVLGV